MLGNQRAFYNKDGLGYEPKKNSKNFENTRKTKNMSHYKALKCKYYNKEGHVSI